VKLLLDQNLSPRLVAALADVYPDTAHVRQFGLDKASDDALLAFARNRGFIVVSKDADFLNSQIIRDQSVKIVSIRHGNCSTKKIESILRCHADNAANLAATDGLSVLMLY